MLSRIWDVTIPGDNELAGDGDDEIRTLKSELKEHFEQDHHMSGVLDPLEANCDGYHNKVTLYPLESDPSIITGAGIVYSKIVDGVIELFWMDDDGLVNQLTENGVIKLNTLQNDINANGHSIRNLQELKNETLIPLYSNSRTVNTGSWSETKTLTLTKKALMRLTATASTGGSTASNRATAKITVKYKNPSQCAIGEMTLSARYNSTSSVWQVEMGSAGLMTNAGISEIATSTQSYTKSNLIQLEPGQYDIVLYATGYNVAAASWAIDLFAVLNHHTTNGVATIS